MGMRAADGAQPERIGRRQIRAIPLGAIQLGHAIHARQARADRAGLGMRFDASHRVNDPPIAGAAAQHAAQRLLHLGLTRRRVPPQQFRGGDQHARRADAALRRAMRVEARHQRLALGRGRDALHRLDLGPRALAERREAGAGLGPIHQHRAGAAIARITAELGAGQAEAVPQRIRQPRAALQRQFTRHAIHQQRRHAASLACARATNSAAAAWR